MITRDRRDLLSEGAKFPPMRNVKPRLSASSIPRRHEPAVPPNNASGLDR